MSERLNICACDSCRAYGGHYDFSAGSAVWVHAARPLRASWEWRKRLSDWLEDVVLPWLRR